MNLWKLAEAKKLERIEAPLPAPEEGLVRVRVTKVLLSNLDAALYAGDVRVNYPLILGRYAVGFVAEEGNPAFPKGTRVLLHAYRPVPLDGTEKRDFSADDYYNCGRTIDGFLCDFVNVSPDDMTVLPMSVNDERALLIHHVAAAKEIVERLDVQKGQHIVVVGADLMGILLCQLLIYQQAAPILVDADKRRLDFARTCGVYYTVPADTNAVDAVASVTGGRLASGAVHIATASGNSNELPFLLCTRGSSVVFFETIGNKLNVDLGYALKKNLTLHCVSHGVKYLPAAINLIANRAVDPAAFRANAVKSAKTAELLEALALKENRDETEISFVDLLQ